MVEPRHPLTGRKVECEALDRLLASARAGTSGVLVLSGEAGVGKTALLDYVAVQADGFHLARASSVEAEVELVYAGLHQVCAPLLWRLDALPPPQRDALGTAFGLRTGEAPDRFLVGLAVLTLLSDAAERQPIVCLLDDAQWLDRASLQVLGFVARRLAAESVVIVFAAREPDRDLDLAGLPRLAVGPLGEEAARALLLSVVPGKLDDSRRGQDRRGSGRKPADAAGVLADVDARNAGRRIRSAATMDRSRGGSGRASGFDSMACRTPPGSSC